MSGITLYAAAHGILTVVFVGCWLALNARIRYLWRQLEEQEADDAE